MLPSFVSRVVLRRFALALLPLTLLIPQSLRAQATAPPLTLGNVNLKSTATGNITFTFTATQTQISGIAVTTQGATGLDFSSGTAGTNACTVNGIYSAGATCNVAISFSPLAPGLRQGAATLTTTAGSVINGFVFGVGVGALLENNSTTAYSYLVNPTGSVTPTDVTVDAANNVYVLDNAGSRVLRYLADGSAPTSLFSIDHPVLGIAVDGAGNLILADAVNARILQGIVATGTLNVLYSGFTGTPGSLAFDASGNLYVAETNDIIKIAPSGTRTTIAAASPVALTVSPAGDLYWTSNNNGNIVNELVHGTSTPITAGTLPVSNFADCLALDPAGNLFVTTGTGNIYEFTGGGLNSSFQAFSSTLDGIASAPNGNLYIAYTGGGLTVKFTRTVGNSFNATGATAVGSTSSQEFTTTYFNDGNAPMSLTSYGASNAAAGPSTTCSLTTPLAINASCVQSIEFSPKQHGSPLTGSLTLTGNVTPPTLTVTGYVTGDAVKLGFGTGPANLTAGNSQGTITVQLQDNGGVVASTATNAVTLTVTGPSGLLQSLTSTPVNGIATFSLPSALTTSGSYTYTATATSLTTATATITVAPAAAASLTVTPASTTAYIGFADNITVSAFDTFGNLATSYTGTIALTTTDSTATLPANFTLTAGTATKPVTFATQTNSGWTVKATDTVTPSLTQTSVAIVVTLPPLFTITSTVGDTSGTCTNQAAPGATLDSNCTVSAAFAAITALNNTAVTSYVPTINFAPALTAAGPITITMLQSSSVTGNFNLVGPGAVTNSISLSGGNSVAFVTQSAASLSTISGLTLKNFKATGNGSVFNASGGSITNIINNIITGNVITGIGNIYVSNGALTLTSDTFTANTATTNGGAVAISGALGAPSTLTINQSTFSANSTGGNGGALFLNSYVNTTITASVFGGQGPTGTAGGNTAVILGGAIFATTTPGYGMKVYDSLFSGNTAGTASTIGNGGAVYFSGLGTSYFYDDTFTANTATGSNTLSGSGGAFYQTTSTTYFYNVTIAANTAKYRGGGVYRSGGSFYVYNSIIEGNSTGSTGYPDIFASLTGSTGSLTSVSTTTATNPLLSPLGNYGGSTLTMVPLPGSPALRIGSTSATVCTGGCFGNQTVDQRGIARITNGSIDAGAVQTNYSLAFAQQPSNTTVGALITPTPSVQVYENGTPFNATGGTIAVSASSGTPSLASVTVSTGTTGPVPLSLSFPKPQFGDSLIASVKNGTSTIASASSALFNITNSAASLAFVAPPAPLVITGGSAGIVTVAMTTSTGTTFTTGADILSLSVSGTGYTTATYQATAVNGIATFNLSAVALPTAGTLTYTVSDISATPYTTDQLSTTQTIAADTIDHFTVTGLPAFAIPGTAYTVTVKAIDPSGLTDAAFTGPVFLTSTDPSATFLPQNYTFTATDNGVHTFFVTLNTSGTQSLSVRDNSAHTGTQTGILVGGSVWALNATGTLNKLKLDGSAILGPVGTASGSSTLGAIAFDAAGNVWSVTPTSNALDFITRSGTSATVYTGGSLNAPASLAVDGAGTIWVGNSGGNTLSVFTNAGAPKATITDNSFNGASGIAIDSSGNVWVTNATTGTLNEVIGGAAPAAPLANAIQNSTTGVKP